MSLSTEELTQEIIRLGPWHNEVEVRPGLTTRVSIGAKYPDELGRVTFLDWHDQFVAKMLRLYPGGLDGRSVFDCSCNCGECLFWAKEIGAGDCFGSDVREHWIRQARFLLEHREPKAEGITFEVCDLYDVPKLGLEPFDITFVHGLFYHLPDPITGLRIAADLTSDLIVVNTATRAGLPDGLLSISDESREAVLSGVYGLNWYPTGPEVIAKMLRWMGFVDTELIWWIPDVNGNLGRLELVASKDPDRLAAWRQAAARSAGASRPAAKPPVLAQRARAPAFRLARRLWWALPRALRDFLRPLIFKSARGPRPEHR